MKYSSKKYGIDLISFLPKEFQNKMYAFITLLLKVIFLI